MAGDAAALTFCIDLDLLLLPGLFCGTCVGPACCYLGQGSSQFCIELVLGMYDVLTNLMPAVHDFVTLSDCTVTRH